MSHDAQAAFAVAELAQHFQVNPGDFFTTALASGSFSAYAAREPRSSWPVSDGVIQIERTTRDPPHAIAVEFKRPNEGVHGILTALGQAHAYLAKGFSGSIIVIPNSYDTLPDPGGYLTSVLDSGSISGPVGVFSYREPDLTLPSPFKGRLTCARPVGIDAKARPARVVLPTQETQWVHVREGSTTPDAYYRYLSAAKSLASAGGPNAPSIVADLLTATGRAFPGASPERALSNAPGVTFADDVWRQFWFQNVLTPEVQQLYKKSGGTYLVDGAATGLVDWSGRPSVFFASRSDSIKAKLVEKLNSGAMTERDAWAAFAVNIRSRAHSFREDIDSGLDHIGFLAPDGRPSEAGYRFVEACERTGNPNSGVSLALVRHALLTEGDLLAFLHYVYSVSDELFRDEPLRFTTVTRRDARFDADGYRHWLRDRLANILRVMNTARARGGVSRKPLQAEFAILRKLGLVRDFRAAVGLEVNWPAVHEAASYGT